MAVYKVVDAEQLEADLTTVADAIREKGGTSEALEFPQGYKSAVESIQSGGSDEEFVGIKYLKVNEYNMPEVVDARSLSIAGQAQGYANMFANVSKNPNGGQFGYTHTIYTPPFGITLSQYMFESCGRLENIIGDFTSIQQVGAYSFKECIKLKNIPYMPNIENIEIRAFQSCTSLSEFKFYKKPTKTIATNVFESCTNLLDIYVPWAEGEVANAPWGASNATIHYNTTYDENHNPIV